MSTVSASSSKREKDVGDLTQELEAIRSTNNCLRMYLQQLRQLKHDLLEMNNNFKELANVNSQFIDLIAKE